MDFLLIRYQVFRCADNHLAGDVHRHGAGHGVVDQGVGAGDYQQDQLYQ